MGKATLRHLLATACRAVGLLGARERAARSKLNILCYHRILPPEEKAAYFCPDLVVTPEAFRAQCRALATYARVLPLAEALLALREGPSEKPLVALTFDDGYVDNLKYAAPILAETGLQATFFVVADLMGTSVPPWYDLVARCVQDLRAAGEGCRVDGSAVPHAQGASAMEVVEGAKDFPPEQRKALVDVLVERLGATPSFAAEDLVMDASQVQELAALGHEIGSHSVSHEILPLLDDHTLLREVRDSKHRLEEVLGAPVASFCYPNGDYDARTLEQVAASGYDQAVTTLDGDNPCGAAPFTLRRRFIHEGRLADGRGRPSTTLFRSQVCGLRDGIHGRRGEG